MRHTSKIQKWIQTAGKEEHFEMLNLYSFIVRKFHLIESDVAFIWIQESRHGGVGNVTFHHSLPKKNVKKTKQKQKQKWARWEEERGIKEEGERENY